jgi:hypothetical protein
VIDAAPDDATGFLDHPTEIDSGVLGSRETTSAADLRCTTRGCNMFNRLLPVAAAAVATAMASAGSVNVTTWRYDMGRTGQNLTETTLTPSNVNATTFGKLYSYAVDGDVYAEPLYLTGISTAARAISVPRAGARRAPSASSTLIEEFFSKVFALNMTAARATSSTKLPEGH